MSSDSQFKVQQADFATEWESLKAVRHEVFVVGQNVPPEIEWAGDDDQHWHVLATDESGQPIGTGRVSFDGKIGRMAVLEAWRGRGVGGAMLQEIISIAKSANLTSVYLASQLAAIPFYERFDFVAQGDVFVEADIAHRKMVCSLVST
jgi:predicted GNAT family N-acyltransferase